MKYFQDDDDYDAVFKWWELNWIELCASNFGDLTAHFYMS